VFHFIKSIVRHSDYRPLVLKFIAFVGITGGLFGYALEHWGQWPACILCHVERIILLAWAVCALVSLRWSALLWGVHAVQMVGIGTATYHALLQFRVLAAPAFCHLSAATSFHDFMMQPTAACQEWTLTFLGLPAPVYLVGMWLVSAWVLWPQRHGAR